MKLTVAYITLYDPLDMKQWSGLGFYIYQMLQMLGYNIHLINNMTFKPGFTTKLLNHYYNFKGIKYDAFRDSSVLKSYASQIESRLPHDVDIIFSPGSLPVAFLKTAKPVVIYTDATFASLVNYYPEFTGLQQRLVENGNRIEKSAIKKANLIFYSSQWAANSAINDYGADPEKVVVVPFGANIPSNLSEQELKEIIEQRSTRELELLFVGVDWKRKGGDIALEIAREIKNQGIKVTLNVVGVRQELPVKDEMIVNHGFLDKNVPADIAKLYNLYKRSHFFILPSRQDCTPVVFSEANSFGLPCITTNVGGIPDVIRNEVNGFCFSLTLGYKEVSNRIISAFTQKEVYRNFCLTSFNEYITRLSWDVSGCRIKRVLEDYLQKKTSGTVV